MPPAFFGEEGEKTEMANKFNPGENELKETLKEGIRSLKEKEQMVLSLYYSDELTMKEIASVLEISEPRVSQIHASAIHKLEQYLRKQMA